MMGDRVDCTEIAAGRFLRWRVRKFWLIGDRTPDRHRSCGANTETRFEGMGERF
jgi:hypothetical protein